MDKIKRRQLERAAMTATLLPERYTTKPRSDLSMENQEKYNIMNVLFSLQADMTLLMKSFNDRLSYDKEKELAFERLYDEMDELKQGQSLNRFRAIFVDLILMIDRMNAIYND